MRDGAKRIAVVVGVLLPLAGVAAPARVVRPIDDFRLVFLDGDDRAPVRHGASGDAMIDVGQLVSGRHLMKTIVTRRFRLRIDGSAATTRFVRVRAFVQLEQAGQRVRLDGRVLTSAPQLVDAYVPLHVAVAHTVEIEVPASEPEGAITQTIMWLVEDAQ